MPLFLVCKYKKNRQSGGGVTRNLQNKLDKMYRGRLAAQGMDLFVALLKERLKQYAARR
ncbi:MAG: hypothetical protein RR777_02685 [Christensenellaceae bacterium]